MRAYRIGGLVFGCFVAIAGTSLGQTQPVVQGGYQQPVQGGYQQPVQGGYQQPVQGGYQQPVQGGYVQTGYQQPYQPVATSTSKKREPWEMGALYGTSAAYGVGLGIWASVEMGIDDDPGIMLIPPIILGVAAPIGAYALDNPTMKRGQPTAITAGLLLGAGEGLGIWGTQRVNASERDAWGFRGLARSEALGATVGGIGGYLAGEFMEPPAMTSLMAVSGAAWGTAIGSMFGYGASSGDWGEANDQTSIAGLVGYNAGMVVAGGLGAVFVPSATQLGWMWAGSGIGAAVSLPVFLLYAGEGGPPARRGFIFMGTATTLGVIAGGVFSSRSVDVGANRDETRYASRSWHSFAKLEGVVPTITQDQVGVGLFGTLE